MEGVKNFTYVSRGNFSAQARIIKKIHPEKIPYISGNGAF